MFILERLSTLGFQSWMLIFLFIGFFTIVGNIIFTSRAEIVHKRIEEMNIFSSGTDTDKIKQKPLHTRIQLMIQQYIEIFLEKNMKKGKLAPLKTKLKQANFDMDPIHQWTQKVMYSMGLSGLSLLLMNPTITIVAAIVGFFLPDIRLSEAIKKRQYKLKSEIPDFLDLLAATAPSAKNLEDAIKKVCVRSSGEIVNEFVKTLDEVNAGRQMKDALKDMSIRCGVQEIDGLVSQINQAEAFGTGVEKTLVVQSERLRTLKKQLSEIKARKASVMLILPSLFLLVTCLILIAGPSIVAISDAGQMFGG